MLVSVLAQPAVAADVTYDGAGMTIAGGAEASRLAVRFEPNVAATVHDDAGGLRPGLGCLGTPVDVTCGLLGPLCFPCSARIGLGGGDDALVLAGTSQRGPFLVDAGAGDDDVHITGDANASVAGGSGRDMLRADAASELDGGEGPDVLRGEFAVASYASRGAGVRVDLDGAANDGAPGEGDDVRTRAVVGGDGADVLTGSDAANELSGRGANDVLDGAGGADVLRGDGGADRINAGTGDDRIEGSREDTVNCGVGSDVALGLRVPGIRGDCEAVFATTEEPYLTLSDIAIAKRRPSITVGWHDSAGPAGPPISASGVVEMRYHGAVIGRRAFTGLARPDTRTIALRLTARGKALACRAALTVRLLVVATGQVAAPVSVSSRSAIRRVARLPRTGTCATAR